MDAELRNTVLGDALQTGDMAAIAFALRHGPTVVPFDAGAETDDVWTYRDPSTGRDVLLLFSDAAHRPAGLPTDAVLLTPVELRAVLTGRSLDAVYLDIAGPFPLQASPADVLAALEA